MRTSTITAQRAASRSTDQVTVTTQNQQPRDYQKTTNQQTRYSTSPIAKSDESMSTYTAYSLKSKQAQINEVPMNEHSFTMLQTKHRVKLTINAQHRSHQTDSDIGNLVAVCYPSGDDSTTRNRSPRTSRKSLLDHVACPNEAIGIHVDGCSNEAIGKSDCSNEQKSNQSKTSSFET